MIVDYNYWYFSEAMPINICEDIIRVGKERKPDIALTGSNRKTSEQDLKLRNSNVSWIDEDWLYGLIFPFVHEANTNAGWNFQYEKCEPVQFTEYKPGQHYDWHYDYNSDKNDQTIRKLSIVVSLSNPSEYEGGDFLLSNANVSKPAEELTVSEIKPKGSILVFPSFLWHKVVPVTKGVRYSAVAWMRGKNFV